MSVTLNNEKSHFLIPALLKSNWSLICISLFGGVAEPCCDLNNSAQTEGTLLVLYWSPICISLVWGVPGPSCNLNNSFQAEGTLPVLY